MEKLPISIALGALAVAVGKLLQQDFGLPRQKVDLRRHVLIRTAALDDVGQCLLRRGIEDECRLDRDRRPDDVGAVGFAAHAEHMLLERRQTLCKLKFEAVPAVTNTRFHEIRDSDLPRPDRSTGHCW